MKAEQGMIHLWIGPRNTCLALGYNPSDKSHRLVTQQHELEGWYRPVTFHLCTKSGTFQNLDLYQAYRRIFPQFKTIIRHKVNMDSTTKPTNKKSNLYNTVMEGERKFFEKRGIKRVQGSPWKKHKSLTRYKDTCFIDHDWSE